MLFCSSFCLRSGLLLHTTYLTSAVSADLCFASSSVAFLQDDGYWNLVEHGTGIVARLMLASYQDRSGWWHELLHKVVHGETSKSPVFFKDHLFWQWSTWFENGEWKDVPEGRCAHGEQLYRSFHPEEVKKPAQDAA